MLLTEETCRRVLHAYPKVLETIKGIVELRALHNQEILEAFSTQVFHAENALEANDGLWVKDLNLKVILESDGQVPKSFSVLRLSPESCVLETDQWFDSALLKFEEPKQKILKDLSKLPAISIRMQRSDLGSVIVLFDPSRDQASLFHAFLPKVAQAKLKGLVYPEYDATALQIRALLKTKAGMISGALSSASLTNGKLLLDSLWPSGELALMNLSNQTSSLVDLKALSLGQQGPATEFQFECDTQVQKESLDKLIHTLSQGVTKLASASKTPSKQLLVPHNSPVITRRFSSVHEFIRTFLSTIDAGMLKLPYQAPLAIGAAVRVRLLIPYEGQTGERKISCQGTVKQQKEGVVLLSLDDSQQQLRQRLENICKESVEKKSTDTWEERKNELLGLSTATTPVVIPLTVKWALLACIVCLTILAYVVAVRAYFNAGIETVSPWK